MSSQELTYWLSLYSIEPFGQIRQEFHSATIAYTSAKCAGAKVQLKDFMQNWWKDDGRKTPVPVVFAYFKQLASRKNKSKHN